MASMTPELDGTDEPTKNLGGSNPCATDGCLNNYTPTEHRGRHYCVTCSVRLD